MKRIRKCGGVLMAVLLGGVVVGPSLVRAESNRIDQMISPAFHPVTFEDPRALTEARALFVQHNIDDKFITGGGDVQVYALQLRYAVNDKLSIIATKDGFVDFNPKGVVPKDTGLADLEAGLKYTLLEDRANGCIASGQLRFLLPTGDEDVLQGQGDGEIHPSFSAAHSFGDATLMVGTGLRLPFSSDDSSFWDLDGQLDYRISLGNEMALYPLVGASLIQVISDGNRLPIPDEGQDFFNFGASDATGESIVTGVGGVRLRAIKNLDFGMSLQFPFNSSSGSRIIESRWTFDAIVRF